MDYINYTEIILRYALLAFSFFCIYAVTKQGSKGERYTALVIYLVTFGLYTFLIIAEVITPSEDANIGLGFSILLMEFVSIAGIILAGIIYLVRKIKSR